MYEKVKELYLECSLSREVHPSVVIDTVVSSGKHDISAVNFLTISAYLASNNCVRTVFSHGALYLGSSVLNKFLKPFCATILNE